MTKVAYLDAGHGGTDSGAIGYGLYEKFITLAMAKRVGTILKECYDGIDVKYTRTDDTFVSLDGRAKAAGNVDADIFISFHINAGGGTGYEDYIYSGQTSDTTKAFQDKIHTEASKIVSKYGLKNRGKKTANYAVLRETTMPAVLVETLFIDTESDANLLKNATFIEEMCQAYAKAIADQLGGKKKVVNESTATLDGKIYRVQVGAFADLANAERMKESLQKAGFNDVVIK